MINFLFIILLFCFKNSISNEVEPIVIEQNCKSCHGKDYSGNTYIGSIKDLGSMGLSVLDMVGVNAPIYGPLKRGSTNLLDFAINSIRRKR